MNEPFVLQRLLGEFPAATFIEEYYLRLPYSRPGGVTDLLAIDADALLNPLFGREGLDVVVGREGTMHAQATALTRVDAKRFLDDGQTVGLRHVHNQHVGLARLAESFSRDLGGAVDIHLYWTPADHAGFGWHYDAEEVFVLQIAGGKQWSLRKNTVNPWPLIETIPADQQYEREIMPVLQCQLSAGDWLYIPGGYWHSTKAADESLSLSVGIRPTAAIDAYDSLRRRLLNSIEWRERLPSFGDAAAKSDDELVAAYREIFQRLGNRISEAVIDEAFVRSFLADLRAKCRSAAAGPTSHGTGRPH